MRTINLEAHWDGKPCTVLAVVYKAHEAMGHKPKCPSVYICDTAFTTWTENNMAFPSYYLDEDIEDLHDAAFIEALQQEEEDEYETEQASQIGF